MGAKRQGFPPLGPRIPLKGAPGLSPQNDQQEHPSLLVPEEERTALENEAADLPHLSLNSRQLCDLELLLNGAFAPLQGYANRKDYDCVLETMRLENGALWPIPIVLDVSENMGNRFEKRARIALRDATWNAPRSSGRGRRLAGRP